MIRTMTDLFDAVSRIRDELESHKSYCSASGDCDHMLGELSDVAYFLETKLPDLDERVEAIDADEDLDVADLGAWAGRRDS